MIKVYCQQTIGGFKIFNISAFTHRDGNLVYVLMPEIAEAKSSESQEILVTNKSHNGLDSRIIPQFSSGATSMMILGGCGANKNETTLYVSPVDSQLKFAFVTDDNDGLKLFAKMATMWTSETGRVKLSKLLTSLVSEPIINNKMAFAFSNAKWQSLVNELSDIEILPTLHSVAEGKKGFMVYNTPHKIKILKDFGIEFPLSYFVRAAGNDELQRAERNQRIVYIGVAVGCLIAAASITCWALSVYHK